ncbi:hypothetical protein ABPG74_005532 [Tetrahymena malaccensis]
MQQLQNRKDSENSDLDEPLIKKQPAAPAQTVPNPAEEHLLIYMDGRISPETYSPNVINNQKYTVQNFIPKVLYNQFKYFFNLFFLLIALSQFIPQLKVGFLFSYVAPLVMVLTFTMCNEAYDDYKRYLRDTEQNTQKYNVRRDGSSYEINASELKPGDLVEVRANQRVPADLILICTQEEDGTVFIRTDQLDGETDWKLRKAIKYTQKRKNYDLQKLNGCVRADVPRIDIYKFFGLFKSTDTDSENKDEYREPLSLENTLWANTYVAAGEIVGLVIYTGKDTRSVMNTRESRYKFGLVDFELNGLTKTCFALMCLLAFMIILAKGFGPNWFIQYFRFVLLLSSIIPISLRVNLDAAKIIFSYKINNDPQIPGTITRNSQIPEELGRVQYILSDKTGTLTQNDMIFRKLCLESTLFTDKNLKKLANIVKKQCYVVNGPCSDVAEKVKADQQSGNRRRIYRRDRELVVRDIITALAVCHNVTPVIDQGQKVYQASSPDEVALVKIAEDLKMELVKRDQQKIVIKNAKGDEETFMILANFPFTSESKRMGIILRHQSTNRVIFYLKGADSIMKSRVPEVQRGFLLDECENLAREGLRTLVITQKYLTEEEYQEWNRKYQEAQSNDNFGNREEKIREIVDQLELNMEFLGITGVEDKLQEDVATTISSLRRGGINVWMLTGDKVETATCIAISTGLKSITEDIFIIRDVEDEMILTQKLNEYGKKNAVLVIDGVSLQTALTHREKLFFEVATSAPSVVCCRCSPTQKAVVTDGIKNHTNKITLAIGDGGNDVGMIQSAHVGIGIVGKEGKQAALASDYSILKFKYLAKLLLFHGRLNYKRTAVMSQFVIHRGTIISIMQTIFNCIFYFVPIPLYNGFLMLGYTTVYTLLPVFCLLLDQDVNPKAALEYPELYKTLQSGRDLNLKTFLMWTFKSIYQGMIIMALAFTLFDNSYFHIVTITFSTLVLCEILNVHSELNRITWMTVLFTFGTIAFYVLSVYFINEYLDMKAINIDFAINIVIISAICWLPFWAVKKYYSMVQPDDYQTIMKLVRKQEAEEKIFGENVNDEMRPLEDFGPSKDQS